MDVIRNGLGSDIRFPASQTPRVHLKVPDQLYEYRPLLSGQIRLLQFGPKDEQGEVHTWDLRAFDLRDAPQFYALSYVWGQPDRIISLPCNGGRVMVTHSLAIAIQNVRFPISLWSLPQSGLRYLLFLVPFQGCQAKFEMVSSRSHGSQISGCGLMGFVSTKRTWLSEAVKSALWAKFTVALRLSWHTQETASKNWKMIAENRHLRHIKRMWEQIK